MKKILIIEDELPINHVLKAYLDKQFEVVQVFDGQDALPLFQQHKPDLVLLDVMLPHKDGWTILKAVFVKIVVLKIDKRIVW